MYVTTTVKTRTVTEVEYVSIQLSLKEAQEVARAAGASTDGRLYALYDTLTDELRRIEKESS